MLIICHILAENNDHGKLIVAHSLVFAVIINFFYFTFVYL